MNRSFSIFTWKPFVPIQLQGSSRVLLNKTELSRNAAALSYILVTFFVDVAVVRAGNPWYHWLQRKENRAARAARILAHIFAIWAVRNDVKSTNLRFWRQRGRTNSNLSFAIYTLKLHEADSFFWVLWQSRRTYDRAKLYFKVLFSSTSTSYEILKYLSAVAYSTVSDCSRGWMVRGNLKILRRLWSIPEGVLPYLSLI